MESVVIEPTDEPIEESVEEQTQEVNAYSSRLVWPIVFVALIPIFGLCFGDLASLGGLTITKAYLGLTLVLAILLLIVETLISKDISRSGLLRIVACLPFIGASLLSYAVGKLTRQELPMPQTAWTIVCQVALAFWLFYLSYCSDARRVVSWVVPSLGMCVFLVFVFEWGRQGFPYPFRGWAVHKNAMGVAAMCVGGLSFASVRLITRVTFKDLLCYATVLLSVAVLFICGARSSLMVMILYMGFSFVLQSARTNVVVRFLATAIIIVSIAFPVAYVNLQGTEFGDELTDTSLDVTGQDIYNGRQKIWELLLDEIRDRPFVGHARQVAIERDNDIPMNAHNLLLATLYQSGLIGTLGLLFLLGYFWREFSTLGFRMGRWAPLAFLAAVLIRQMLESELTGENYTSMFAIWSALCLIASTERVKES